MSYELIRDLECTSRKEYKCIWCGELIPIATKYNWEFSKFDGHLQTHRWHMECRHAAQTDYDWNDSDGVFNPGEMKRGTAEYKFEH